VLFHRGGPANITSADLAEWRAAERRAGVLERQFAAGSPEAVWVHRTRATLWTSLGAGHQFHGEDDAAERYYRRVLRRFPKDRTARFLQATLLLTRGDFAQGFELWDGSPFWDSDTLKRLGEPWDGRPQPGKTSLLTGDGGYGDVLMFARYAPAVRERVGSVSLVCRRPLVRLLKTAPGIDRLVQPGEPWPPHDLWTSLFMLPRVLETRLETIPAPVPYLQADPADVAKWRARLGTGAGLRVGIVWAASTWGEEQPATAAERSVRLSELAPLARVPGLRLYSLQTGVPARALTMPYTFGLTIEDLSPDLTDFAETAAAMECLDLIISVDTAAAHLAGALGRPVWLLLNKPADWRWLLDREDSPWYATMRLFRQEQPGAWAPVISRVADELAKLTRERAA
jgi:hypothetical protein